MKFGFTRKINPKRFFPEMQYESIDFSVEGCATKQEAQEVVEDWVKEWVAQKSAEKEQRESAPPFEDSSGNNGGKRSIAEQNKH